MTTTSIHIYLSFPVTASYIDLFSYWIRLALQIASKYEEIYPPEVKELSYMTDNAYDKKQVLHESGRQMRKENGLIQVPSSSRPA